MSSRWKVFGPARGVLPPDRHDRRVLRRSSYGSSDGVEALIAAGFALAGDTPSVGKRVELAYLAADGDDAEGQPSSAMLHKGSTQSA